MPDPIPDLKAEARALAAQIVAERDEQERRSRLSSELVELAKEEGSIGRLALLLADEIARSQARTDSLAAAVETLDGRLNQKLELDAQLAGVVATVEKGQLSPANLGKVFAGTGGIVGLFEGIKYLIGG